MACHGVEFGALSFRNCSRDGGADRCERCSPQISEGQAAYQRAGVGASPGGMRTTLPIGEGAALERSAADITTLRSKNTSYPNGMVAINGLIHSLKAVGAKGSGPGTSELNTLKSALYANFSWVPGVEKAAGDPAGDGRLARPIVELVGRKAGFVECNLHRLLHVTRHDRPGDSARSESQGRF